MEKVQRNWLDKKNWTEQSKNHTGLSRAPTFPGGRYSTKQLLNYLANLLPLKSILQAKKVAKGRSKGLAIAGEYLVSRVNLAIEQEGNVYGEAISGWKIIFKLNNDHIYY